MRSLRRAARSDKTASAPDQDRSSGWSVDHEDVGEFTDAGEFGSAVGLDGAAPEAASGAARPRSRRRAIGCGCLAVVLVLVLALGGAAYWAESYARAKVDTTIREALPGLSQDASITTQGLVLPQLASGSLDSLDITASSLDLGPALGAEQLLRGQSLVITDLDASLKQVAVRSPRRVGQVRIVGHLDWNQVAQIVELQGSGLSETSASANQDLTLISIDTSVHGVSTQIDVAPSVTPEGNLMLDLTSVDVGGVVSVGSGQEEWLGYLGMDSTEVSLGFLPEGLSLSQARITEKGLELTLTGKGVDLSGL